MWTLRDEHIDDQGRARVAIVNAAGDVIDLYWPHMRHVAEAAIAWRNDVLYRARILELQWAAERVQRAAA